MPGSRVLKEIRKSLPADWYYDADHYLRELEAIWYRDWFCVGRSESLANPGDFFLAEIGDQSIVLTRNTQGDLRAFHNTCRHRGSVLCREKSGHFRNGSIICPYHTWTYSTDGELLKTPGRIEAGRFEYDEYSLHAVNIDTWGGFLFINLSHEPASGLDEFLGDEAECLANWPIETMQSVHQETRRVACNWKLFWENYSECYHCPRLHPELCRIMPVYKHAVFDCADLPIDRGVSRVAEGVRTWTIDGQSDLPPIEGPSPAVLDEGAIFASFTASMFVVAHTDYVRSARIVPTGPESIELIVDWMLPRGAEYSRQDLDRMLELARIVISQDGEICELNQRGLHSLSFDEGVLVGQEYQLWHFHEWLRSRLA